MSVYHGKLLELLSIDRKSDKSFLRVRLSFEQEVELLWEIDHDTAENLKAVTVFGGNYKYRLAFYGFWDSIRKQNVSYVTRTYRDQSDRIYFLCSEEYVKGLNFIKCIQQINQVHTLPFLYPNLPISELELKREEVNSNRYNRKFAWIAVTMLSIISTILFGYSGHANINKTGFDEKTPKKAELVVNEVDLNQKDKEKPSASEQAEIDSSIQPSIPFIELNKVINYSIPEGYVSLTFDDGPSKYTKEIIDVLKKYQVGGTFFFIGLNAKKYPDYVKYVNSNGYSIGNHSLNHTNFTNLSYEKQEINLIKANQIIEEIIPDTVVLFRPPFGAKNELTIDLINKNHKKMVLWNKDTEDWKDNNPDEILNYIHNSKASGSIILLHESQAVIDALPKIIEYLQGKDLKIVSLR
ncbi:polysaccharide deacetylase family protein [Tepidibacillus sp. HK-1]|uniref:polysaccharide deacetylase family protein n=1 Tax=Tepidibacillus sp. HK-1 TaxID=1883407 RepID=UPI000853A3D0|nr:polysaccharide deacetylase family protein [Tepidibacillus sp. HK-1]GBF11509.1 peptidoglycan-N-acetylglucosamine deacetylase [Tepidibacillus sp. HK-1]